MFRHQIEPANFIAQLTHDPFRDFGAHSGHSIDPFHILMRDRSFRVGDPLRSRAWEEVPSWLARGAGLPVGRALQLGPRYARASFSYARAFLVRITIFHRR